MMYTLDFILSAASILVSNGWLSDSDFVSISKLVSLMNCVASHDSSICSNSLEKD